jgi:hypothetical protein
VNALALSAFTHADPSRLCRLSPWTVLLDAFDRKWHFGPGGLGLLTGLCWHGFGFCFSKSNFEIVSFIFDILK